jgi:hypothetical protein
MLDAKHFMEAENYSDASVTRNASCSRRTLPALYSAAVFTASAGDPVYSYPAESAAGIFRS